MQAPFLNLNPADVSDTSSAACFLGGGREGDCSDGAVEPGAGRGARAGEVAAAKANHGGAAGKIIVLWSGCVGFAAEGKAIVLGFSSVPIIADSRRICPAINLPLYRSYLW